MIEEPRTGNCYEDCAKLLIDRGSPFADWTLVHGWPTLQREPFTPFDHAWLEKGAYVHDPSADVTVPKVIYYVAGRIDMVQRITSRTHGSRL